MPIIIVLMFIFTLKDQTVDNQRERERNSRLEMINKYGGNMAEALAKDGILYKTADGKVGMKLMQFYYGDWDEKSDQGRIAKALCSGDAEQIQKLAQQKNVSLSENPDCVFMGSGYRLSVALKGISPDTLRKAGLAFNASGEPIMSQLFDNRNGYGEGSCNYRMKEIDAHAKELNLALKFVKNCTASKHGYYLKYTMLEKTAAHDGETNPKAH